MEKMQYFREEKTYVRADYTHWWGVKKNSHIERRETGISMKKRRIDELSSNDTKVKVYWQT